MRIVVTGSSGLLGRHVAAALVAAGHDVVGMDRLPPRPEARWLHVTADATDFAAALQIVRRCDAVAHIAAIPRPTGRAAEEVFRTNTAAAYNVVEAAVLNGVKRIVYASSMSVLGYPFFERPVVPHYLPFDSAHPPAPQDAYALSKWLGEEIVDAAVRRAGLEAVSLRMPWIQTAESFVRDVRPRRVHADLVARDLWGYLDAEDAAEAFLAAVERPIEGHRRLFISAADTFMEEDTAALVAAAYPGVPLRRPPVGRETVFDLAEAAAALGWAPRRSWRDY
ncbi:NAD-dependent epimerase/dehydratase family protein [Prosthecomicrobium pneumaticum]|uniref:Nucleoside-diphosphate-sugar epimerase n=1 Tax=Prosthecomicrobium pneumaticum TaxID=81895 RepID=A0A7W9FLL0_9HYPH|nr:NAD(P)-dependent oxidoreductase [Prosthecomicrobium pneumaticum]MBB5752923.1 nucleoside-diphosphate-sugar epimerase [Prosthecomicrobium pneumaticum]